MTTYRAAVKYAVDASRKEKVAALREGLQDVAMELVEQFDLTLDEIQDALDEAYAAAEQSVEWAAMYKAKHDA